MLTRGLAVCLLAIIGCGGESTVVTPTDGSIGLDSSTSDGATADVPATEDSAAEDSSPAEDSAVQDAGADTGTEDGPCPAEVPMPGSTCEPPSEPTFPAQNGATCVYGDDPRPECRTQATCTNEGSWQITQPRCVELPDCPASPPQAGNECSNSNDQCFYDDGTRCWCSDCEGGSPYPICRTVNPPQWACQPPRMDCPPIAPNAGDPCESEGASCGPSCELEIICRDGRWVWQQGQCPVCASPDTPIATPYGERPIADLQVGDLVYSVDEGAVVAVPIARTGSTPVSGHTVLRVSLDSGRSFEMSAGHPTGVGVTLGDLRVGSEIDEAHRVIAIEEVPFQYERTHDILPASSTGTYFAVGALVGSTLTLD